MQKTDSSILSHNILNLIRVIANATRHIEDQYCLDSDISETLELLRIMTENLIKCKDEEVELI